MTASLAPKYAVIDNFIAAPLHADLLAFALARPSRFKPTGVQQAGANLIQPKMRQSLRCADQLGPHAPAFSALIHARLGELCAAAGIVPFAVAETELELAAHGDGGFYKVHYDTFTHQGRADGKSDRTLSAVYYFFRQPKGFSGGDLQLHRFGGGLAARIEPCDNRLISFASIAPHEVLPIACPSGKFEDYRFSVNCWLHRPRNQ